MYLAGRLAVTVLNLGAILTERQPERWRSLDPTRPFDDWVSEQVAEWEILAGRFGRPQKVADLVASLVSARAGYLTGASIDIAGGSRGRV